MFRLPDRARLPALALGLTLLAFALRLYRLDVQSLWFDEAWTAYLASQPIAAIPLLMARTDTHPPLFTLLLAGWTRLTGSSDFAVRAFSALMGTLAVPLVWWAGTRLASRRGALFGAGLVATAPFLVYYAQEVRVYAFLAPVYLILLAAAAPELRGAPPTFRAGLAFGLVSTAFLLSFYSAGLAWAAAALLVLAKAVRCPKAVVRWLAGHALGLTPVLLWLPGALAQRRALGRLSDAGDPPGGLVHYLDWLGRYFSAGPPGLPFEHPLPAWLYVGAVVAAAVVGTRARPLPLLGLAVVLPLAAALSKLADFGGSGPHARYLIWLLPVALLAAGEGLAHLWRRPITRWAGALLLVAYLSGASATLARYFHDPRYDRDDFRSVAHRLASRLTASDLALFPYVDYGVLRYYHGLAGLLFAGPTEGLPAFVPKLSRYWPEEVVPDDPQAVLRRLQSELQLGRRVALVDWFGIAPQDPLLQYALETAGYLEGIEYAGAHGLRLYRITQPLAVPVPQERPVKWESAALSIASLPSSTPAGESVPIALRWSAAAEPLGVKLVLRDPGGEEVSTADGQLGPGARHYLLPVPPWLPPGRYPVGLRLYDRETLEPLEIDLARVEAVLGEVQVTAPREHLAQRELPASANPEPVALSGLTVEAAAYEPAKPAWGQRLRLTLWLRVTEPEAGELTLRAGSAETIVLLDLAVWPEGALVRVRAALPLPTEPQGSDLPLEIGWQGAQAVLARLEPLAASAEAVPPAEHALDVRFGDFARLAGFDLETTQVSADDQVPLTLQWQVVGTPPERDLAVFTHLLDAQGRLIGQHDGSPAGGQAPVPGWTPGQTILDPHALSFTKQDYRGPARIEVGLYDPISGERVLLPDGRDHFILPVELTVR